VWWTHHTPVRGFTDPRPWSLVDSGPLGEECFMLPRWTLRVVDKDLSHTTTQGFTDPCVLGEQDRGLRSEGSLGAHSL
jgi:hypothetical protein